MEQASGRFSQPSRWIVVYAGIKVREGKGNHTATIGTKHQGSEVNGWQEGDWLKLATEPGHIMIRSSGVQYLRALDQKAAHPAWDTDGIPSSSWEQKVESSVASSSEPPEKTNSEYESSRSALPFPTGSEGSHEERTRHLVFDTSSSSVSSSPGDDGRAGARPVPKGSSQSPFDEEGNLLSAGSALHGTIECKPCVFMPTCRYGASCRFCHVANHDDNTRRTKIKPCRGKRNQYKTLIRRTKDAIDRGPDTFDPACVRMPSSVEFNPLTKEKFLKEVVAYRQTKMSL